MPSVLETPVVISSIAGAQVVSWVIRFFLDLTIAPIAVADAQLTICANCSNLTKLPVSDEERQAVLDQLQRETTEIMIPAIVFLGCLASSGLTGNTLVIIVYARKPNWSGTVVLIITLAVFDLVASVIAIPAEVYSMLHYWNFDSPHLCRARLFTSAYTTLSSGMILAAIAVIRYRKVCCPHRWQITPRDAKVISIVVSLLGALLSGPYAAIKGRKTKPTRYVDIFGYECTTDDKYSGTLYPLAIYVLFLLLYICCAMSVTVLYTLIGIKTWKHCQMYGGASPAVSRCLSRQTTSCRGDFSVVEQGCNQNKCNSTWCESPCNSSIDAATRRDIAVQSASHCEDYEMEWFHIGSNTSELPIQYNAHDFSDRIDVQTPAVAELFVRLPKAQHDIMSPSCHENRQNNTDNRSKIQIRNGSGEDMLAESFRKSCGKDSGVKMRIVISSFGDTGADRKYTSSCTDGSDNKEYTLEETMTDDTYVKMFHSNKPSVKTISLYDKAVLSLNGVDNDRRCAISMQTAVNEFDHPSVFKRLDVISCSCARRSRFCPNCAQRETSLCYRPSFPNLLQKTEWLRSSVIRAMTRQDDMSTGKPNDNLPCCGSRVDNASYPVHTLFSPESDLQERTNLEINRAIIPGRFRDRMVRRASMFTFGSPGNTPTRLSVGRTTFMLFIISAFYILSYLPYLLLVFFKFIAPDVLENMSKTEKIVSNVFLRTLFINSAVNPIVYSLCDANFRRECSKLFRCLHRH